jgi:hypothetical protein
MISLLRSKHILRRTIANRKLLAEVSISRDSPWRLRVIKLATATEQW